MDKKNINLEGASLMPLSDRQQALLSELTGSCSYSQYSWLSGYFWALAQNGSAVQLATPDVAAEAPVITVVYLSQTGNGRQLAQKLVEQAAQTGITAQLLSAAECKLKQLPQTAYLIVIASTHGEGEAPDSALRFYNELMGRKAPALAETHFAVLALGDSSYEQFCHVGRMLDARLEALGAVRWLDRVDCDADFEYQADTWMQKVLAGLKNLAPSSVVMSTSQTKALPNPSSSYSRTQPYSAEVLTMQRITGRLSDRDVRHIELDIADSGLRYQPGDALGVWFENDLQQITRLLDYLALDAQSLVIVSGQDMPLLEALRFHRELTSSTTRQIEQWVALSGDETLSSLMGKPDALQQYAASTQITDVILAATKPMIQPQQLVDILRGLSPRLYSIASSMEEVDEEVHLCIGMVEYEYNGELRQGGATGFIGRHQTGDTLKVYVEPNDSFHLPASDTDIIMIGAGTGIAPFRAFLQERAASSAAGRNWLFFGNPHFNEDFLYQTEWQRYLKEGVLSRLDVAFSRDQPEKIYVQHKLLAAAEAVWQWLQQGASIYLCGDMQHMAKDVQAALEHIISTQGHLDAEAARAYLDTLRENGRYCRDIY